MTHPELIEGARNCVIDCAEIGRGTRVAVIGEIGTVDDEVCESIEEVARGVGANVQVLWAEPMPKGADHRAVPADVLEAFRSADVVINHYHSLKREMLQEYFPDEKRIRVPNRAVSTVLLGSAWARFPYGLQRALSNAVEGRMVPGAAWHVTTAAGTDIRGRFADANSSVADAFFSVGDDDARARRNFPGGVHSPVPSSEVDGVIAAEYIDDTPIDASQRLYLEIHDGHVTKAEGGDAAGKGLSRVNESDGYLDSWHAGLNPKTLVPISRDANQRKWFSYAHCSPKILHFHLGRTYDTINVAVFDATLTIGGVEILRDGRLQLGADPAITSSLERYHQAIDVLTSAHLEV